MLRRRLEIAFAVLTLALLALLAGLQLRNDYLIDRELTRTGGSALP